MKNFPIYKDEDRLLYLAYWFDRLARHLLRTPPATFNEWRDGKCFDHYDIYIAYLNVFVEVKGTSNCDQFKLFESQLDHQLGELKFPTEDGYLLIFSYRNGAGPKGRQRRLLKRESGRSYRSLARFLAKQLATAYLVDIRLIDLLRKERGTRRYARDKFNERRVVRINRKDLQKIAKDARTRLQELGIPEIDLPRWLPPGANRILPRTVSTVMDGNAINFKLIPLLTNATKIRFLRHLNGDVQKDRP